MKQPKDTYPNETGAEARRRIDQDAKADAAFDQREVIRLASGMVTAVNRQLNPEKRRVSALIKRDQDERYADEIREQARLQAENGDYTNLADSVVPPTPEQLASGEFQTFIPKQPKGTVRVAKGWRRMSVPTVQRIHAKGQISDEGLKACIWYATTYSQAGFDGNIPSVDMSKEVFGAAAAGVPFTERQCEAQQILRKARAGIDTGFLKFFEAVVVRKLPMHRAVRFARLRKSRAQARFRQFCDNIYDILVEIGELD